MAKKTGKLFISHAGDDEEYVTKFVETVLRLGCDISLDKVFYTSQRGTGIKSGDDLFTEMRQQAKASPLVIAIVSPMYLTRPTCLAEMGAAWAQKTLLPVLTPGLDRDDLPGPLKSMLIGKLDDDDVAGDFLDEIHDTVIMEFNLPKNTSNWNRQRAAWLAGAARNQKLLGTVETYSADDVAKIEEKLNKKTRLYDDLTAAFSDLEERYDALYTAKTQEEIAAAVLPKDEIGQFRQLSGAVADYFQEKNIPRCVVKAIRYHVSHDGLVLPDAYRDEDGEIPEFNDAEQRGYLSIDDDPPPVVTLNQGHPQIQKSLTLVESFVAWFESPNRTEDFTEWFKKKFDLPVDSTSSDVWDAVLRS
ncbi:hypothetical protein CH304_03695 [Rhodococcus sp. 15-649-1-2]|nr:toll/interleukin-1 receptor domain-containing protein [Rhodococcus sp. 15-649-1-2]OZE86006.1 hypothetical protein CH304_03695 [Rhodococcus sp. 15-649-1-2]